MRKHNCRCCDGQSGMVLPLLLLVLLGTSSVGIAFSLSAGQSMTLPVSSFFSSQDRKVLADARQAMVTYAAWYPFMYGPRGAGPGHLPCPDTDDWTSSVTPAPVQYGHFRNDSPDPPCGRQSLASGFLPRHVRLAEQRYVFHTEPAQLATYYVSGRFINNPVNRIVNPSVLLSESTYTFAARIELPQQFPGRSGPQVVVSKKALFSGVLPSVAGWVIEKSDSLTRQWCDSSADDTVSEQIGAWQCSTFALLVKQCPQYAAVLLIVDQLPRDGSCSITDLQRLSVDGVPARSHWFFRNQWISWIVVENTELCHADSGSKIKPCALRFLRPHYTVNHSPTGVLPSSDFAGISLAWERLL